MNDSCVSRVLETEQGRNVVAAGALGMRHMGH